MLCDIDSVENYYQDLKLRRGAKIKIPFVEQQPESWHFLLKYFLKERLGQANYKSIHYHDDQETLDLLLKQKIIHFFQSNKVVFPTVGILWT